VVQIFTRDFRLKTLGEFYEEKAEGGQGGPARGMELKTVAN
jgi:hypothetical protein